MAPKRVMPGAADASAPFPAKVARCAKADLQDKLQSVCDVLATESLMPPSVPKRVLEMLASGVPHALASASEERHTLQSRVIDYVHEVFDESASMLSTRLAEAQAAADSKSAQLDAAAAKIMSMEADIEAAGRAVAEQRVRLTEKEQTVKTDTQEAKSAQAKLRTNAQELAAYTKQRDGLKTIEETGFLALVEGSIEEKEAKKACAKFIKDMEKLGAESSLLASAPAVLLKPKDLRQGFDQMVIDSVRSFLAERISVVDASIAATQAAGKELEAAVATQDAVVETSRHSCDAEANTLKRMEAEVSAKREQKKAQEAEVEALRSVHAGKIGEVADVQEEVQFLHDARVMLDDLVARSCAQDPELSVVGKTEGEPVAVVE